MSIEEATGELFAPIPMALVQEATKAKMPIMVLAWCHIYSFWYQSETKDKPVPVSQNGLAKAIGCDKDVLGKSLLKLVELGWLDRHKARNGGIHKFMPHRMRRNTSTIRSDRTVDENNHPIQSDGSIRSSRMVNGKPSDLIGRIKRVKNSKREGGTDTVVSPAAGAGNPPPEFMDEKPEYPDHCADHRFDPDPPACGGCAKVRTANEQRRRDEQQRQADEQKRAAADKRKAELEERRRKKENCTLGCDGDGYLNGRICYHDPEQAATNVRGAAAAKAAARGELTAGDALEALVRGYGGADQSKLLGTQPGGPTPEQAAIGNTAAAALGSLSAVARTAAANGKRRRA